MITEELLGFIRGQYAAGMSVDEMKSLLIAEGGWETIDIEEALQTIGIIPTPGVSAALSDVPSVAEDNIPETPPLYPISSVQYAPSVEIITPARGGSIQDTAFTEDSPDADDFLGIFSQHQEERQIEEEESLPPEPFVVDVPSETPPLPEELPPPLPPPVFAPTPALTQVFVPPPEPSPVPPPVIISPQPVTPPPPQTPVPSPTPVFVAPPVVIPPPISPLPPVIQMTFTAPTPVPKEPEVVIDMTPQETAEVARSFEVPREAVASAAIAAPVHQTPLPPAPPQVTPPIAHEVKAKESKVTAPPPAPPAVAFDLSMLRKNLATASGAAAANALNADAGKIVETKSVAELWLAGARKEANSSTSTLPASTPSGVPVRPKILSRRTMSSDILLRGVGAPLPGMPALSVPEEAKKLHPQVETASGFKAAETRSPAPANAPSGEGAAPAQPVVLHAHTSATAKFPIKHVASVLIGLVVLAAIAVGGWFMFTKLRGPDLSTIYSGAFQQFFGAASFGYQGSATTSLVLSTATDGVDRSGKVEFSFDYAGLLANGADGYGDGSHHIKFKGGLHTGNFQWVTDLESEVRLIGGALYFHVLSFPDTSNADPDLFRTYWVKFDLADITKQLAIEGMGGTQEGYGGFGAGGKDMIFNTLIQQNPPFSAGARLPDEILASGPAYHIALKSNPDQMVTLAGMLYHKYTNADLVLDANQKLRLRDALAKIQGDILIDQKTNMLMGLSLKADLDDDIVGVHVKGPLALSFVFSDLNKPVEVAAPTPMLTLEELRVHMDDYKKVKEERAHDTIKQNGMSEIQTALEAYRTQKGRYPTFLADLVSSGKLSTSTMSEITLKTYFYAAYVKPDVLTKSGLCSTRGKVCAYYHLGVNFEDMTDPALGTDADQNTELRGGDTTGCGGEPDVACYDVVSAPVDLSSTPVTPAPISTTTKSVP